MSALAREHDALPALVRRETTLAAGFARFLTAPLMRASLLVRHPAALAGNLTLLVRIHGRESAIFLAHLFLHARDRIARGISGSRCRNGATPVPFEAARHDMGNTVRAGS